MKRRSNKDNCEILFFGDFSIKTLSFCNAIYNFKIPINRRRYRHWRYLHNNEKICKRLPYHVVHTMMFKR